MSKPATQVPIANPSRKGVGVQGPPMAIQPPAGDRQLHLDGAEHLPHLVVELTCNPTLFLFACVKQPSREPLQVDRRLLLARALSGQASFEPRAMTEREYSYRHADREGKPEHGPHLLLQTGLHTADFLLLIDEGGAIERLHLLGDADGGLPPGHEPLHQHPGVARPLRAISGQHFVCGDLELARLFSQPCDAFPLRGRAHERDVPIEIAIHRLERTSDFFTMRSNSGRIEQRIAHEHRGDQHLCSH